jgi:DNA-binding Xre family transcriptional regulator
MVELQRIETNGASEMVVLTRVDYDRLLARLEDAEDMASAKSFEAAEQRGEVELLPLKLVKRLLNGEEPIAVWRDHRGLTQKQLASNAGMTAAQLSQIISGKRTGSFMTMRRIAETLKIGMDDLIPLSREDS